MSKNTSTFPKPLVNALPVTNTSVEDKSSTSPKDVVIGFSNTGIETFPPASIPTESTIAVNSIPETSTDAVPVID